MKRPTEHEKIKESIGRALVWKSARGVVSGVGHTAATSHDAARAWGVHPNTARAWLNKWADMGYVGKRVTVHRVLTKDTEPQEVIAIHYVPRFEIKSDASLPF